MKHSENNSTERAQKNYGKHGLHASGAQASPRGTRKSTQEMQPYLTSITMNQIRLPAHLCTWLPNSTDLTTTGSLEWYWQGTERAQIKVSNLQEQDKVLPMGINIHTTYRSVPKAHARVLTGQS